MITVPDGSRLEPRRVQSRIRLGYAKTRLVDALDQWRQAARFLHVTPKDHHRIESEDVHVHRRSPRHARTRFGDRFHHKRGFGNAKAGAAVALGHCHSQPAIARERGMKIEREAAVIIFVQPIIGVEVRADFFDRRADRKLVRCKRKVHSLQATASVTPRAIMLSMASSP